MSASLRTFRMFRTESHLGGVLKQDEERRLLVDDARPALFFFFKERKEAIIINNIINKNKFLDLVLKRSSP